MDSGQHWTVTPKTYDMSTSDGLAQCPGWEGEPKQLLAALLSCRYS